MTGLRCDPRIAEGREAAVEAERLPAPESAHDAHRLVEAVDLLARRPDAEPERGEFAVVVAAAQTKHQPATRQPVERLGHLRKNGGMPVRDGEHAGGDLQTRG